jgi:hypothetical protein
MECNSCSVMVLCVVWVLRTLWWLVVESFVRTLVVE